MSTCQGYRNWNHWNVSLWIHNDYGLYCFARDLVRSCDNRDDAARIMLEYLNDIGTTKTPDGAPYTFTSVRAALVGEW